MVVDMPYNTYRNSKEALKNAKLVMRKTKCEAIKLEGGSKIISVVKTLVKNKIPDMGHLGEAGGRKRAQEDAQKDLGGGPKGKF